LSIYLTFIEKKISKIQDGVHIQYGVFLHSGIRQKLQNSKVLHILEEQTPKNNKNFVAKK
jgi:hypothetical protein